MKYLIYILFISISVSGYTQYSLTGTVVDENNAPLSGSHIHSNYAATVTDTGGAFSLSPMPKAEIRLYVSFLGYVSKDTLVDLHHDTHIKIQLLPEADALDEVVIESRSASKSVVNKEVVSEAYLKDNFAGSLAKTLEKLPGVNVTEIGAGASKPIIRGLGFNRVAVTENGVKHEGQQWGADHGLEIDALAAEELEVVKNSGAIEYGSDAIGGVINIKNDIIPQKGEFSGEYTVYGKSLNNTLANSLHIKSRKDKFFYKLKATISDYGDYSVPTDNIVYLTINMPVYNNRLKNTAGKERNFLGQIGFVTEKFQSILTASNTYLKAGFFPGAHGIPSVDRVRDDGNSRNIEYPYQRAEHFKITSTNKWLLNRSDLLFSVSWQNNRRQEFSEFHTHFGNQQAPAENPDLELDFNLNTFDTQLKWQHFFSKNHKASFGIQAQLQENTISGYGFLLPEYKRNTAGIFALYDYVISEKSAFNFGVRGDLASLKTEQFYDPILYEYLIGKGETEETAAHFALRGSAISRNFSNLNFLAGFVFEPDEYWSYTLTAGTNFRLPTAIELAANGIHHGSFRHEQGNANLDPEKGIVADAKITRQKESFALSLNPFLYYFSNYIFLQPSGTFSPLPHGGQIYNFTQSKAVLTGLELSVEKTFYEKLRTHLVFEYLYNRQITDAKNTNYPLPFSPPVNGFFEIGYQWENTGRNFRDTEISANTKFVFRQERIAQNEQITDGYTLFGFGVKTNLIFDKFRAAVSLQAVNLLNTKYFNHTNFYRALEIPEPGRNIQLMIKIPFGGVNG